jgi:hypothetical protein
MRRMWGHSTKKIFEAKIQNEEDLEAKVINNIPMDNA